MTKKQKRDEAILLHGFDLVRNFGNGSTGGPVTLCKALRRLETSWGRKAEAMCNGELDLADNKLESMTTRAKKRISELLPNLPIEAIKINLDPRGYALKVRTEYMKSAEINDLHKDWGGYGILAPEIN